MRFGRIILAVLAPLVSLSALKTDLATAGNTASADSLSSLLRAVAPMAAVYSAETQMEALSNEELAAQTAAFREQLANGATLDDLLVPAFAAVREAGRRFVNMRHFDVQLIGGIVLHRGKISEMKTGEGKTLVATLPCYLNALDGKGVHVVTVNDYLAKRDSEWMGRLYKALGLQVGVIVHDLDDDERRES